MVSIKKPSNEFNVLADILELRSLAILLDLPYLARA
jgi:hypothetical protein